MYDQYAKYLGRVFVDREAVYDNGLHNNKRRGIAENKDAGATAIVLSGGYEDDEDHGNRITYTGEGGRDETTGKQVADQKLHLGNLWLVVSHRNGLPVRVIRKVAAGYRYDGLYRVIDWRKERPPSHGHLIYRYELVAIDG